MRWEIKILYKLAKQLVNSVHIYVDELLNPHWICVYPLVTQCLLGLFTLFFFLSLISIALFFI